MHGAKGATSDLGLETGAGAAGGDGMVMDGWIGTHFWIFLVGLRLTMINMLERLGIRARLS